MVYFSLFALWCNSIINNDGCLSTVGNYGFACSVAENTMFRETGDASLTESCEVPVLDSGSSNDKSVT